VAFSPDGSLLACGSQDGTLQVWDIKTRRLKLSLHGHQESVDCLAVSADGRSIASAGRDRTVRLWDVSFPHNLATTNSLGMKFMPVPAGEFQMGSPDSDRYNSAAQDPDYLSERPRHRVTITKPFMMSMYEVTVAQFRSFVEATGYKSSAESTGGFHVSSYGDFQHQPKTNWRTPGFPQGDDHPVVHVTSADAEQFCRWLSEKEGKRYRLPTEAEWEYACRAGSNKPWSYVENGWHLQFLGNTADTAMRARFPSYGVTAPWNDGFAFTAPVGSFAPNPFGLYDMHGNVYELCQDWFSLNGYAPDAVVDPQGPPSGKRRIKRGGSFAHEYTSSRSASRARVQADRGWSCLGFRPVLVTESGNVAP
jgi:formylglycine-generating enzyme required for sulfatase activity